MSHRQTHLSTQSNESPSLWLATLICTLATTFLLYEFILQVSPSVMTGELMRDLGLLPAGLGATLAFYYYAYTPMQIPAGLLFDRFGPRLLLTIATLICAIGAIIFGIASGPSMAAMGRFLMGIGSAFAFIGALVLTANWFPPHYFAVLTGIVQLSSCIGAIGGQAPLVPIINQFGWRNTINSLGIIGIVLALLIWLIVRDTPHQNEQPASSKSISFKQEMSRLVQAMNNKQTWWIGLYSFMVWAPMTAFVSLWIIPFLSEAYGFNTQAASNASAIIWLGVGIGSPLLGWWSDKLQRRCLPLTVSALLGAVSLSLLIYWPLSSLWFYINLFIVGLGATGQALAFGVVKDNNRPELTGTAIGFNNMAVVASGAIFQPLIGWLLVYCSKTATHMAAHGSAYTLITYQKAFIILPACYLVAALVSHFLLRETYCRSQAK
jgi:MFS family permease